MFLHDFCDKTETIRYRKVTKEFMLANDEDTLRSIVKLNEKREEFCPKESD